MNTEKNYLLEGETVKWEAEVSDYPILDSVNRVPQIVSWSISGVILIAFLALYLPYAVRSDAELKTVLILLVAVVGVIAVIALRPFTDKKKIMSQNCVVTNGRAIVASRDGVLSLPVNDKTLIKSEELDNGNYVILFGDACKEKPKAYRTAAIVGVKNNEGAFSGLVFYNIEDLRGAMKALGR